MGDPEALSRPSDSELLKVTMSTEAADKFYSALSWATAVASIRADEHRDAGREDRAEQFAAHAEWLRWGIGRMAAAGYDREARHG